MLQIEYIFKNIMTTIFNCQQNSSIMCISKIVSQILLTIV